VPAVLIWSLVGAVALAALLFGASAVLRRQVKRKTLELTDQNAALRESEARFEEFADHFPGYLFMHDEERRYVYVNRREDTDADVLREDWLGKTPTQVWEGEDAARSEADVQRALDGEVVDVVEPWMPPGLHEHLHSIYFPIPRPSKPPLVGGFSIDVTEQVEAQEEVRRQAEQLRRTVEGAVLAMSHMVESRDPYTAGHERRVAELATAIGVETGMAGKDLEALRLAGTIHDIGKIAVPAEILSKPGRLSEVEFELIKQHPETGFDILGAIDFGRPVAEIVLQHHERLDGSGYPRALTGEDILPEARILAVADVVEAMSSHRPYRAALGMDAALAEIREHAGVKYDADVAAAYVRLVEEQGFLFTP
jgi:PAS domain S-box-containing protein